MSQQWDYSLIITQTALAISVLTTWHDGFSSFIKKATITSSNLQDRDLGEIYAQNLYTLKENIICQFFRKPIIFLFNILFKDKILLRIKFLMKTISLGSVIFFIVYCYCQNQSSPKSSLEIQWTYLAWIPFIIWFLLLIFSWFLGGGILWLNWMSKIETNALLNFHREKIETSPSSYEKDKSGNLFLGIILYMVLFILLIPIIILDLFSFSICLFFLMFAIANKILSKLPLFPRFKNWVDSLCAHKPICPLCNQIDTCNKGNCNMCCSNASSLTTTAPCPNKGNIK